MIDRDGKKRSVWQTIDRETFFKVPAPRKTEHDVVVIGAGITGVSTALQLQKRGFSCLLVDAHTVGYGTTSGTSAHLNTVLDTPYAKLLQLHGNEKILKLVEAVKLAWTTIERNIRHYKIDCDFEITDGCMYAANQQQLMELEKVHESIESVGISVHRIEAGDLPFDSVGGIRFGKQGRFHPIKYIFGLLRAYFDLGGELLEHTCVDGVRSTSDGRLVITASGSKGLRAKKVVYATHTPPGIQLMNFRLVPYRSYIQVFQLSDAQRYPDQLWYDLEEPFHYCRIVKLQGQPCLMVGGQDHQTAHHPDAAQNFRELTRYVRGRYSVGEKLFEWSSQFYESQDYLPFIGKYPSRSRKNEFLATGFGGNGMIFGTLSSLIIADLIQEKANDFEALVSPSRLGPMKSLGNVFSSNMEVIKRFVVDRFTSDELVKPLALGRGEVINMDGEMIGIAKSLDGWCYLVNAVCRHAGCVVKWNTAEQSWDCPCHGARYAPNGGLLNGPATGALECLATIDPEK